MFARRASTSSINAADASDTTKLNDALVRLNEIFPNQDAETLRRKLSNCSSETKLYVVTDALLKASRSTKSVRPAELQDWERFRSEHYKASVKTLLVKEFRGLSRSTVKAVLAENNHDYTRSRSTLLKISSKSWRFAVSTWWYRRPAVASEPEAFPKPTQCVELDQELFMLGAPKRDVQIQEDNKVAKMLNEEEHASCNALIECQCCFGDYAWEEIVCCQDGHFICHTCVTSSVKEGLYGQGKHFKLDLCTITCLSSTAVPACQSYIPNELLKQALPNDIMQSLDNKAAQESLTQSGLTLLRCPFCPYAEVDEVRPYRVKRFYTFLFGFITLLLVLALPVLLPALLLFVALVRFSGSQPLLLFPGRAERWTRQFLNLRMKRIQHKTRGQMFRCHNKFQGCGKSSCSNCLQEWKPFHKCFEKEEDGYRIYVEKAMAEAVKRTCPLCATSFVKIDGCNKMTCPCGYVMCYLCRADIKKESYQHFCQHFRQKPGTGCTECDKCDLYIQENESQIIKLAAQKAAQEYYAKNNLVSNNNFNPGSKVGGVRIDIRAKIGSEYVSIGGSNTFQDFLITFNQVVNFVLEHIFEWDE